jgi:hypothetical protein
VNPCRTTTCTANSFAGGSEVGVPQTFTVTIRATNVNNPATAVNGAGTYGFNPAATDNLSVSVKDPASTVVYNNPDAPYTYAFPNINSNPITYTPMSPGTYTMSYAFPYLSSGAGCGASATASFHPYFSVLGGDVAAGLTNDSGATPCVPLISGPGNTSIVRSWNFDNNPAGNYYGAGGQTGVFALAQISSFISGLNPLAIPTAATAVQTSLVSPVKTSFANTAPLGGVTVTPTTGTFGGGFGSYGYCLDDYVTEAQNRISATSPGGNTFTIVPGVTPSGTYKFAGPVTVTGGLSANQRISVVSGADIVMGSDFTYPLGVGATGAVPYFEALAAGSIYVNHGVHNLFGFYDAQSGAFATCANGTTETTDYDTCNSSLTIDGAVSAKAIHFDRTFGNLHPVAGLPDTGKPAEVIRFSPAFWIGALGECTSDPTLCQSNGYPYDSITSLPPVLLEE